jgi:ribosomal protein S18 acetylase RimI-like enzyme
MENTTITYKPLKDSLDSLSDLIKSIEEYWKNAGYENDILPYLEDRIKDVKEGKAFGVVGFEIGNPQAVSLAWVTIPNSIYGTILLHSTKPEYQKDLTTVIGGVLGHTICEIISFGAPDLYLDGFEQIGFRSKFRQRMGLKTEEMTNLEINIPEAKLYPLSPEQAESVGYMSCVSHLDRKDMEGYIDYSTPELCAKHKKELMLGKFGPMITGSSWYVTYKDKPAGSIMVLDIACWGYDHMGWIFDIALMPEFQGKGLGKLLIAEACKGIKAAGLPMLGLAVTYTNEKARLLYEKMGFLVYEDYYEVLGPQVLKEIGFI